MDSVLFLDIDGPLCTGNTMRQTNNGKILDPDCVKNLYKIVIETGCKIVLSSTWRLGGLDNVYDAIRLACISNPSYAKIICNAFIGSTPFISTIRGKEIQAWIDDNSFSGKFIILDDMDSSDMLHLSDSLVQVDFNTGLTDEKTIEVIQRLKN